MRVSIFVGWFCLNQKFSFWGRKLCETRKLRVLIWILRKFRIEFRIFRVLQNFGRRVVSGSGACIRVRLVSKLQIILHAFSCHMHMCRRRRRRSRVRGDRRATGAAGASSAGELWAPGARPNWAQCRAAARRQALVHILLFEIMIPIYVFITFALHSGVDWNPSCMIPRFPWVILAWIGR